MSSRGCTGDSQSSPELKAAAERLGRRLIDVRQPPPNIPVGTGRKRTGKRLLTVGTDCALGKKYTALAITGAMRRRGVDADFRATGQTGIMIAGSGMPMDAVISDFVAGAAEILSPDAAADHWDVIEGQGSLFHPAYAGVSLGLLHGSQPDVFVLCHEPGREHLLGYPGFPTPSLPEAIARHVAMGSLTNAKIRCAGVSFNTASLPACGGRDADAGRRAIARPAGRGPDARRRRTRAPRRVLPRLVTRPSWFQRFLLPGFAFKAVVIGGGYSTGREIAEFFVPLGPWGGVAAMALAMGLWSVICVVAFLLARKIGAYDYRPFFRALLGPRLGRLRGPLRLLLHPDPRGLRRGRRRARRGDVRLADHRGRPRPDGAHRRIHGVRQPERRVALQVRLVLPVRRLCALRDLRLPALRRGDRSELSTRRMPAPAAGSAPGSRTRATTRSPPRWCCRCCGT